MRALTWALHLRDIEPTVKLLAIYLCNGLLTARYRDVDVEMAADFCGVPRGTILKLAKQLKPATTISDRTRSGEVAASSIAIAAPSECPTRSNRSAPAAPATSLTWRASFRRQSGLPSSVVSPEPE
jgi:hypothetical protein